MQSIRRVAKLLLQLTDMCDAKMSDNVTIDAFGVSAIISDELCGTGHEELKPELVFNYPTQY